MWEKIKPYVLNVKTLVAAAFGLLFLLFKWEKKGKEDAQAELEQAEYKKNDAVLAQQEQDAKAQLEKDKASLDEEKKKKLTDEQMAEYLKSIGKK